MPQTNYSTTMPRGLEGQIYAQLETATFVGNLEGFINVDSTRLPFGRVVVRKEDDYAGGVGLPSEAGQSVAGVSYFQAQYEADAIESGNAGVPNSQPVTLAVNGVVILMVPETNIAKGAKLYFRHTMNGTPGAHEALGRIRANADTAKADEFVGATLMEDAVAGTPCMVKITNIGG